MIELKPNSEKPLVIRINRPACPVCGLPSEPGAVCSRCFRMRWQRILEYERMGFCFMEALTLAQEDERKLA